MPPCELPVRKLNSLGMRTAPANLDNRGDPREDSREAKNIAALWLQVSLCVPFDSARRALAALPISWLSAGNYSGFRRPGAKA